MSRQRLKRRKLKPKPLLQPLMVGHVLHLRRRVPCTFSIKCRHYVGTTNQVMTISNPLGSNVILTYCARFVNVPSHSKSLKRARQTTSEFHRIQRELDIARRRGGRQHINNYPVRGEQHELDHELSIIGGRQAYQEASLLTTGRHRTCKWVFSIITKLGLRPKKSQSPLEVLEVGAVNTQLLSVPWLSVRAIDIKVSCLSQIILQIFYSTTAVLYAGTTPTDRTM